MQLRVFISSTFRDMHAERDHLVTVVFPELRERIERLGLDFFDVDLRWGVPVKDANGETANSWEFCRKWIDLVEPFFVCILGQRYGWVPEPEQLKSVQDAEQQRAQPRSITDMEVRHAVFGTTLKRRSYFYMRSTEAPSGADEFVDPPPLLRKLEQLKNDIRASGRPVRDYACVWTGSGFAGMEEEFGTRVLEDLWSGVLRDEQCVSRDVWRQVLGADPSADPLYTDDTRPIPRELWEKIVALAKPEPVDPLDAEREQMKAFATARLRWFHGRSRELQQLIGFLQATGPETSRLAVVAALPGQGKSALLAKLSTLIPSASAFTITHFIGASERSASSHALVERLLSELDRSGIVWPDEPDGSGEEPKRDFASLCLRLGQRLGSYSGERRIVIMIDALNQLADGYNMSWLPPRLGPSVRLIISCVEDAEEQAGAGKQHSLAALESWRPAPLRVSLGPLTQDDVRTVAVAYLEEYCHELDREHLDALSAVPQARNPLYLLVMLSELRTLGGNDLNRIVPARIASMAKDCPDSVRLFRWALQRMEQPFGADAVRWWCLYLAESRVGMTSRELADLLARKLGAAAAANALRIERGLRRYLQRRGPQLDFFHEQLRQAVFQQYAADVKPTVVHSELADFFRYNADPGDALRWKLVPRPLGELLFHLGHAKRQGELRTLLSQLAFLAARTATGQIFEQIADYALAGTPLPPALVQWRDFLQRHAQRLAAHPAMLVALASHEGFPTAQAQAAAIDWRQPWLRTTLEQLLAVDPASVAQGLRARVTGGLHFDWGAVSAIADEKAIAFRLERLGVLAVFDLEAMRKTDVRLSIARDRPLVLVCAPDASAIVVFFETGVAQLYQCIYGQDGCPASLRPAVEFRFHLPETEDPVMVWHEGAFWYQATAGSLAVVSLARSNPFEQPLPDGQRGELSALVFAEGAGLIALRQGSDTLLLASGAAPQRRQACQVAAACACGGASVAVAFTDGFLVVFELGASLSARAEALVGMLRGTLGWDGTRLLWMAEGSGFMAWRPADAAPQRVLDDQEVFPSRLHVIPRQWLALPDNAMMLGTTHAVTVFQLSGGGSAADGRLEELAGGPLWRAVRRRDNDQWLLERRAAREKLLGRGVLGRFFCGTDGKNRFFAATGHGPGLVLDPARTQPIPIQNGALGISAAAGDADDGCWFADRRGGIHYVDAAGQSRQAANVTLQDMAGPQIGDSGSYLVWWGQSSRHFPGAGADAAITFVFFRKSHRGGSLKLERVSEHFNQRKDGFCLAVCHDPVGERLVTLWATYAGSYFLRVGPVREFSDWHFQEREVSGLGELNFFQAALSANGELIAVVNAGGEVSCVSVADGGVKATLAGSRPFTSCAPGSSGPELWLLEAQARIYKCTLVGDAT
jgi:Domain of unknown function (DUF4062)